jgi:hypothetical protein
LPEPLDPHYGGGIIRNSDFSAGLQGWSVFGYGSVAEGASASGNKFAVATNRTRPYQSVSQKLYLQNDTHYTLSGEEQLSAWFFFLGSFTMKAWGELYIPRFFLGGFLVCSLAAGK